MMRFPRPLLLALCAVLLAAAGAGVAYFCRRPATLSLELATPVLALSHLQSAGKEGNIFRFPGDETTNATAHDPGAWRALDRQRRFEAVLLTGDPAGFRPLLDHLRKSPDWTLTMLDPTSLVFERAPAKAWSVNEIKKLGEHFANHPERERVAMRVQTAHRLSAIGEVAAAKMLLTEALEIDPDSSAAWTESASIEATIGQWDRALQAADRALKADKDYLPACAIKAHALFSLGKPNEALALTRRLIAANPEDGQNLVLHAKVTHAAHAYWEEIEVLKTIIEKSQGKPVGSWRIYLAQAYAAVGEAEKCLEELRLALKEPELTEQERAFAEKGIRRIESRESIL